jgi:2,3-dihydroxybenzoate decarboxylase
MNKIALEEHFSTPELSRRLAAKGPRNGDEVQRRLADFDQLRLDSMDQAGIQLAVLSVTNPGVQAETDLNNAVRLARETNDLLAAEIAKRPLRYAGFATLPTQDGAAAAEELDRAINELGFKGAMIHGQTHGKYLDDETYLPLWERIQENDVPVYLHPGMLHDHPWMLNGYPALDGPLWSWTADTGAHVLRLIFSGTFQRFPKLRIILGHMGETLPYFLSRFDSRWQFFLGKKIPVDELPSSIFLRHFFITTSGVCDPVALNHAVAVMGEDRVMFSADYPYEDCQTAAQFIDAALLNSEVRAKICHANATRILKL